MNAEARQPAESLPSPGADSLAKVYVEITTQCNLNCGTCVRNAWDEPFGYMSIDLFQNLLAQLRSFGTPPSLIFAGYGEPLIHPDLPVMLLR